MRKKRKSEERIEWHRKRIGEKRKMGNEEKELKKAEERIEWYKK